MKQNLHFYLILILLSMAPIFSQAQAWNRHSKVLSAGFGVSRHYHLDDYYYGTNNPTRFWYLPSTYELNLQLEFAIHRYIGLGVTTGLGGRRYPDGNPYPNEVYFPIGMIANFHFFQLIADDTKKSIGADKVDMYGGLNIGTGLSSSVYHNTTRTVPLAFVGVHAGIRYYVSKSVGLNAEVGWGKSLVNLGLCFKL